MDRFTVTETRTVARADGSLFARATIEYFDVPREQIGRMEAEFVQTLAERLKWGEEAAALHAAGA